MGFQERTERSSHELRLDSGATLVLYTDGLVESRGSSIDAGLTRLVASLQQAHELGVEQISDLLMDAAASHEDDIALLVLRG